MTFPTLHNQILEKLFYNRIISDDEIRDILNLEKNSLISDIENIIHFCKDDFDAIITNDISFNILLYSLYILKEIDAQDQLELIIDILDWDEESNEYWFGDIFNEYYWILIYHFGLNKLDTLVEVLKKPVLDTFSREQVAMALYQIYLKNTDKQSVISLYWNELLDFYNQLSWENDEVDDTYLAFFTSYIAHPTEYQKSLIKSLYIKGFIDETVNGAYENLFEVIEPERQLYSVFDLNRDLKEFEDIFSNESTIDHKTELLTEIIEEDILEQFSSHTKKIGRNDPCPCGSGKKYKKCCIDL